MNKLMVGIFILCISMPASIFATSWAKAYGGNDDDFGSCIQQTSDGGYIIASFTTTFGDGQEDFLLVKLNSAGVVSWSKTFGDAFSDIATTVKQTSDGGYIMVGGTRCFGSGQYDFFVVKTDASGNLSWAKALGSSDVNAANAVQQTSDGGYIVAGFYSYSPDSSDIFVIKLTSTGTTSWSTRIGGSDETVVTNSIQQTTDGGYIVAGWTTSYGAGGSDFFVIKLASGGSVSWARTYGGASNDAANAIQQTSDGGYLAVGNTNSYGSGGGQDIMAVKLTSTGTLSWAATYGGASMDNAWSTYQAADGEYMVVGETQSFGMGARDFIVMKLGSTGNVTWAKTFGGTLEECANWVTQSSGGEFIVAGDAQSFGSGGYDILVIKVNQDGTMAPACPWYTAPVSTSNPTPNSSSPNVGTSQLPSNITASPTVTSPNVTAVNICQEAAIEETGIHSKGKLICLSNPVTKTTTINYEVPFNGKVSLKLYDISGNCVKTILTGEKQAGSYSINVTTKDLSSGVYLVSLNSVNLRETRKLILVK